MYVADARLGSPKAVAVLSMVAEMVDGAGVAPQAMGFTEAKAHGSTPGILGRRCNGWSVGVATACIQLSFTV